MIEILDKSRLIKKRTILTIIFILMLFTGTGYCVYDVTDNWAIALTNEPGIIVYWSFPADLHYTSGTATIDRKAPNIVQCDPIGACSWTSTVRTGDSFKLNSSDTTRTIQSVDSDNQMTLLSSYTSNASKAAYRVERKITYQVAYHTSNITEANWATVSKVNVGDLSPYLSDADAPGPAVKIANLSLNTTYYIRVRAYDNSGNPGNLSNEVSVTTTSFAKTWSFSNISDMTSDSWMNLTPSRPPGSTSQVFLAYDPTRDRLITWGGHPYGGGFPRVNETYYYNIGSGAAGGEWQVEDRNHSLQSDEPAAGCMSRAVYDDLGAVLVKIGESREFKYNWQKKYHSSRGMDYGPWIYDFSTHIWYDMRAFGFREYMINAFSMGGYLYNPTDQVVAMTGAGKHIYSRFMVYDFHSNKFTKFQRIDPQTELGGDRSSVGLIFDSKRKIYMVVGGMSIGTARGPAYNDVWEWNWNGSPRPQWKPVTGISNSKILPYTKCVDGSAAVYDSIHDRIILFQYMGRSAHLPATQVIATYIYDPGAKSWSRGNDLPWPGASSSIGRPKRPGDINAIFSQKHNAIFLLVSSECQNDSCGQAGDTTQTYVYRYDVSNPVPTIAPPTELKLTSTTTPSVQLSWNAVSGASTYKIYRVQSAIPWNLTFAYLATVSAPRVTFTDSAVTSGDRYYYYVTAVDVSGNESTGSNRVRSEPKVIRSGYVAVTGAASQKIYWTATEEADIAGYNVYRREMTVSCYPNGAPLGPSDMPDKAQYDRYVVRIIPTPAYSGEIWTKLNGSLVRNTYYADTINLSGSPPRGCDYKVYGYRIRQVNNMGVEGGWSPFFATIPEPVKGVRMTKDTANYYISWSQSNSNGEGISGYRVYANWKDGSIGGFVELTTDPITSRNYTVAKSSDPDGNYQMFFVTAVDSLGQEGMPSGGTWGDRPYWSNFYYRFYGVGIPAPPPLPPNRIGPAPRVNLRKKSP